MTILVGKSSPQPKWNWPKGTRLTFLWFSFIQGHPVILHDTVWLWKVNLTYLKPIPCLPLNPVKHWQTQLGQEAQEKYSGDSEAVVHFWGMVQTGEEWVETPEAREWLKPQPPATAAPQNWSSRGMLGFTDTTPWEHSLIGFTVTSRAELNSPSRMKARVFTEKFSSKNSLGKPLRVDSLWWETRNFSDGQQKEEFISTTNIFVCLYLLNFWSKITVTLSLLRVIFYLTNIPVFSTSLKRKKKKLSKWLTWANSLLASLMGTEESVCFGQTLFI